MSSNNYITFKWLGVGGIELKSGSSITLIDPYLTRISASKLLSGEVKTDKKTIDEKIKTCDHLFVTHTHFDHMMDVPYIVKKTECRVYGSTNTLRILSLMNISSELMF